MDLDNLQIKIVSDASSASTAIESFIGSLNKLSTSLKSLDASGLKTIASNIRSVATAMRNLDRSAQALANMGNAGQNATSGLQQATSALQGMMTQIGSAPQISKNVVDMTKALRGLSGVDFSSAASTLPQLSASLQGMTNVLSNAPAVGESVIEMTKALSGLGNADFGRAAATLPQLTVALRNMATGLANVPASVQNITELANAIANLGYKRVDKAITNIPRATAALQQMMQTLSQAPAVSQSVIQLTQAIAQLNTRTGTMPTQTKRASTGWNTFSNIFLSGSKRMQLSSFSLAAAWGKMYASFFMVFRAFNMLKKAINLSAEMTEQQHIVDVAFGEMSSKVTEFSKNSIKELGMSQLTVAKTAGRFQAMGNALGITGDKVEKATANFSNLTGEYAKQGKSMADMSLGLTRLTADMSAFYNMDYADTAEAMQTIFTGQARPLMLAA